MAAAEKPDVDAVVLDPAAHYESPMHVVRDPRLTRNEKQRVLESWARDAELISQAEEENMSGPGRPRLQEVQLALLELEKDK